MSRDSGWFVLTGRPCSGISTTARALADRFGHRLVPEAARSVIDEGLGTGRSVAEIRGDDAWFQREILRRKIEAERRIHNDRTPTIFDRALPDSIVYFELSGLDAEEVRRHCRPGAYAGVFFLEPLRFEADYARTEDMATLARLEHGLYQTYIELGYRVVHVPPGPIEARVALIQNAINRT